MPNKKRRNKNAQELEFELPPTKLAKTTNLSSTKARVHNKKRKHGGASFEDEDDTPKQFARLMAWSSGTKRIRSGLDDDAPERKKRKKPTTAAATTTTTTTADQKKKKAVVTGEDKMKADLQIQPGEHINAFYKRVDAALPISLKNRKDRNPQKKEEKEKEKEKKRSSAVGDHDNDDDDDYEESHKRRHRGKNKGRATSPDPFAELAAKRAAPRFGDIVKAPPKLVKPKAVLHSRGIADVEGVPKKAGSLAKREGLAVERRGIVEAYRKMMEGKKGDGGWLGV